MWTRAELKSRAKANLSRYYGPALLVSFIAGLFSDNRSGGSVGVTGNVGTAATEIQNNIDGISGSVDSIISNPGFLGVIASILVVAAVIGLALAIFVAPVLTVGRNRFYMESRELGCSAGAGKLLWGLKHGYLNIIWTIFLKNLLIILGTCCCIIPGFYFAYCYYMVPYILAENPDMRARDAMRLSKEMMEGQKWKTFILEVSFWGWWLLGSLICGIGGIFVQPYYDATFAELYAELRQKFQYELNGFGGPNHGNTGYTDYEYDHGTAYGNVYGASEWREAASTDETSAQPPAANEPAQEVKRSEGGPGRGYYLNGVFYPYTEDELRELEDNRHKK